MAWLFRFAVAQGEQEAEVTAALCEAATAALKQKGYHQVLVYMPVDNGKLDGRYEQLGFNKGGSYTCYWNPGSLGKRNCARGTVADYATANSNLQWL